MNSLVKAISAVRHNLDVRRTARGERRRLENEIIAMYATPSGRAELDAIIGRHTSEEVATIEAILGSRAFR